MAFKKYAYYNKGNKVALVEAEMSSSGGNLAVAHCTLSGYTTKDTCEAAGGQWIPSSGGSSIGSYKDYKSPIESITDGLEIEYAYNPKYTLPNPVTVDTNKFYLNGWIVVDGYLTFVKSALSTWTGWTQSNEVAVDEYILVRGSNRWNGLHKVQEVQASAITTHGGIKTYTKVSSSNLAYLSDNDVQWTSSETITAAAVDFENIFSSTLTPYVWVSGSSAYINNGFYSGPTHNGVTTLSFSDTTKYYYTQYGTSEASSVANGTNFAWTSDTDDTLYLYEANRDAGAYLITDVNILNDESDTLPISEYLSKAVVYYVKAKLAEDVMNIEAKEYFMREFHRLIERYDASKIHTIRMVQTPPIGIR